MLNAIWAGMILLSVIVGLIMGRIDQVVQSVTSSAKLGFEVALGLTSVMALWLGIMAIASSSGLVSHLARVLNPVMQRLFPSVPKDHPAMGAIIMNISANMLGLGNAATPFGLEAMKELQKLNQGAKVASDAMCTFLAINTSSVQLIPVTAIAFLATHGNKQPNEVIFSALVATLASTCVAIITVKWFAKLPAFKIKQEFS
jgi:spore maturation protein A